MLRLRSKYNNNCLHIAFDSAKEMLWCIEFTVMAQFTTARHREVFRIVINKRDGDCQEPSRTSVSHPNQTSEKDRESSSDV